MRYLKSLISLLEELDKESNNFQKAVDKTVEAIKNGGIIHILGYGHYNVIPMELFFKPGALACINPLLDLSTLYSESIYRANYLEKNEGYGKSLIANINVKENDIFYIASYSGRDLVAIDVCLELKKKGIFTIGIINKENSAKTSKHSSKKNLKDLVDLAILVPGPSDELLLALEENRDIKVGPLGVLIPLLVINDIFTEVIYKIENIGIIPPVFRVPISSKNQEINEKLIEVYRERVRGF
ncbi:sugar isomerase domain-containing protein [Dictyoglomus thermophilum]|uniref:SIS domain-containing protein n=1 Tax=Dictyoglomus thermophilum (strain ATCC 35947 / DSM 3960 / H-6-12) TaxID=309799 RepID=B5YCA1_DICT6|nr:sugar isomerase domain-containing protein [Dictyoglomus thermophilum]ACI19431.1 conserved hypothetical protein [Dictyoglomus thermophilum H-6-12]TYT24071.1 sugar isomerase domain-containing protein [Dictyoglomus thermophilum]